MTKIPMQEKWYKQFWPWFLISVPLISMILGGVLLYLAVTGQDSLVSDDYYKEGKAINMDITKTRRAQQLGLVGLLTVQDDILSLTFEGRLPPDNTAIKARFFHTTIEENDFTIMLTPNAQQRYSGALPQPIEGNWRVTLSAFDESWKIQRKIALPMATAIRFEP